jgi:hypothetical protein
MLYVHEPQYNKLWGGIGVTVSKSPQQIRQEMGSLILRSTNGPKPELKPEPAGLGNAISSALSIIGITEERVSGWLGKPCGCKERRDKLNQLGAWAKRVLTGKTDDAIKHLDDITKED